MGTWGKHTGGVPHKHSNNNYDAYCKSLGFGSFVTGSDKYGTVRCNKGALFWCKGYDFSQGWHWCDWSDGKWKTNGLHYKCLDNKALVQFSCKDGKSGTTKSSGGGGAVFGKAKDSGQITTCTEGKFIGYSGFLSGSDKYGTVSCNKGALFGCTGYDFNGWHWCDWQDGRWKNNGVDYKCIANRALISITCKGTDQGGGGGTPNFFGKAKDSGQITTCTQGMTQSGSVVTCKY